MTVDGECFLVDEHPHLSLDTVIRLEHGRKKRPLCDWPWLRGGVLSFPPHLFVCLRIWLGFTALTFWIAEHGINQYDHRKLVILTTLGTILGPMTGAISRNCQSCCLAFSLSLLPYCGAFLIAGTLPLFIKLPFTRGASALRMTL